MSTINLLPDNYVQSRAKRRTNVLCLVLFAVVMCVVVCAAMASERNQTYTRDMLRRTNDDYARAAELIGQMQYLDARRQQMREKAQTTASLVERIPRSTILAVITNARPKQISLVKVKLDTVRVIQARSPQKTKFQAAAKQRNPKRARTLVTIEITGRAGTDVEVGGFIQNLRRHPLFQRVDLEYTKSKKFNDTRIREFGLIMELNPNIDAMDAIRQAKEWHVDAHKPHDTPTGERSL